MPAPVPPVSGPAARRQAALAEALGRGDWKAAEKILRRDAAVRGAPAPVFYNLAKVLEADGRGAQSGHWLKEAVRRDPAYAIAWFELGRWMLAEGDLAGARRAFAKAASGDPSDGDAWLNLARLECRLGNWRGTLEALGRLAKTAAGSARELAPELARLRYRAEAELGETSPEAAVLLLTEMPGAESAKAVSHTGRGHLPFRLPR